MRNTRFAAALTSLTLFVMLVGLAAGAQSGYVAYSLSYSRTGSTHTLILNESVSPTANPNLTLLTLAVRGLGWNFTYSVDVNSTLDVLPYVPSITNRSFTYSGPTYMLSFSIYDEGYTNIMYGGQTYRGTLYVFSGQAAVNNTSYRVGGNITAFPSGLLYALYAQLNNSVSLHLNLIATNLPLAQSDPSTHYALMLATAGVGAASVAVIGLGLPFLRRVRRGSTGTGGGVTRDYWVD